MAKKRFVIEDKFECDGFPCVCIFNAMAIRVGYVGVDSTHPYYGMTYDTDGPDGIMCHWGLTYSDKAYWDDESDLWWFGFDCGHCGDKADAQTAMDYGLIDEKQAFLLGEFCITDDESVRDLDFVKDNCRLIAAQLGIVVRGCPDVF